MYIQLKINYFFYKYLGGFATNNVNLSKLESFQIKTVSSNTCLFAKCIACSTKIQKSLEELAFHTVGLDILGFMKQVLSEIK